MRDLKNSTKKIIMHCDGGARGNPGPAAIGVVIKENKGKTIYQISKTIGNTTNNIAEYKAVIAGLEWIKDNFISANSSVKSIKIFLDSTLVVNQLNGVFKVKNKILKELHSRVLRLEESISSNLNLADKNNSGMINSAIKHAHIIRELNKEADALVNKALDSQLL